MKFLKITFFGPVEPNADGHLTSPVVHEQLFPLEFIETYGGKGFTAWRKLLPAAQTYELEMVDLPDPKAVVPQQVSDVNPPNV